MLIEVKVPQLSESVSEATLVSWHKKEGDAVGRDENLIDIETDKVVLETPAPAAGVLVKIVKNGGDSVTSGEVIATIDTEATAAAGAPAAAAAPAAVAAPAAASSSAAGAASPSARKILDEKGVAAADVSGSGRGGRVTKEDAVAAQSKAAAVAAPAVAIATGDRPEQRVPMTRLRARIAERLIQSKNENAILTTFNEVNMAPVMALRKQYAEKFEKAHGVRLGFMGFFVKAAVAALKKYPVLNAS
ncbi:2-oxo acid dehydrogenase subunit E2, partial [Dokdonella sp.]|uniref:2-oxo acid dehydrogenase subunit E2 n=1 Tax=Dokdonella sp. TaxID=2291710 RepID=UPI002DD6835E